MYRESKIPDLELKEINSFHGTENYYKTPFGYVVTDGVKYMMDNGYYWLIVDILVVIITDKKVASEPFLVAKLKLLDNNQADLEISDGNNKVLKKVHYQFTHAKYPAKVYIADRVVMLPSEY